MAIFYYIKWIVASKNIEGGKLFKGGNYLQKYSISTLSFLLVRSSDNRQKKTACDVRSGSDPPKGNATSDPIFILT